MANKNLLIVSTSTVYGSSYLAYMRDEISSFFEGCRSIVFIPYARPGGMSHDDYTSRARSFFAELNIEVKGVHEFENAEEAIAQAEGVFTGGGNTFVLLDELYKNNLIQALQKRISDGMPYMGTSAGSNITGLSVRTTNDMPIVYPPSFDAIGAVPFNINPHYLDPNPDSKHMGETRGTRINEFHHYNDQPVVGLREGSWIHVNGDQMMLRGTLDARIFEQGKAPAEVPTGTDLKSYLNL